MSEDAEQPLAAAAFLVGRWTVDGQSFPAAYGDIGRFGGDVVATWGPRKAWIRLEQTSNMGTVGSYSVVVLVYREADLGRLRCFSVDSGGSGRAFEGHAGPDGLVFTSELLPADGTIQRLTYAEVEVDRVRALLELSYDGGLSYRGHTEAFWSPRVDA